MPTVFDKTILFWLEFLLEPMANQHPNYQLLHGPSTDLESMWPKFKFLLKIKKKKRGRVVVVRLERPLPKWNVFTAKPSGFVWGLNVQFLFLKHLRKIFISMADYFNPF